MPLTYGEHYRTAKRGIAGRRSENQNLDHRLQFHNLFNQLGCALIAPLIERRAGAGNKAVGQSFSVF
jgi:hypothetical protein